MSFVIPKTQKLSIFNPSKDFPGPGQYNLNHVKICSMIAPFNSSKPKQSLFDCEKTQYGPGSYQAVNLHKLYQPKKAFKETSIFNSKVERFKTAPDEITQLSRTQIKQVNIKNINIISEETKYRCKDRINDLRVQNRVNRVQSIKNNQFVRVILTVPGNTQNQQSFYISKNAVQQSNGPTSYNSKDNLIKKRSLSLVDWNKNSQPRFQNKKNDFTPGPGAYQLQSNQKNIHASASFCYSGMRSYISSIIYKTNIPLKATILQKNKVKSLEPGPGHYKQASPNKKSFNKNKNGKFGTNAKRFNSQKSLLNSSNLPGPGQYDPNRPQFFSQKKEGRNSLKEVRKQLFKKYQLKSQHSNMSQSLIISDNNYIIMESARQVPKNSQIEKEQLGNLKQRCSSKFGNMGQEPRFKQKPNKDNLPGPGSYCQLTPVKIQQDKPSHKFNSVSNRKIFPIQNSIPFYNIEANDISNKLKKMKKHIIHLKKTNIEKAPFTSTSKRFAIKPIQKNPTIQEQFAHLEKKQKITHKRQTKVDGTNIFKSKSMRKLFINQKNPGPGYYYCQKQLEKKSFNRYYNYEKLI